MLDRLASARSHVGTVLLLVAAGALAATLALRLFWWGGDSKLVAALALLPYVTACGVVLACVCLLLRRWRIAGVVGVLTVALAATVMPRVLPDEQPRVDGASVRMMALNLRTGQADAAEVVDRVRDRSVDVLCLLELTPTAVFELQEAGLFEVLPNQTVRPAAGAGGVGIAARHPLTSLPSPAAAAYGATVRVAERATVDVVAVHTFEPLTKPEQWRSNLAELPAADTGQGDRPRILAGDFNATLDHAPLRDVLDSGYVDAAERRGEGLSPTWPDGLYPPPVTIDHILAPRGSAVRDFATLDITGSDHDAVYAEVDVELNPEDNG